MTGVPGVEIMQIEQAIDSQEINQIAINQIEKLQLKRLLIIP